LNNYEFKNLEVEKAFNAYSEKLKDRLLVLRHLIFKIAEETKEIGDIEETLKWGNPSYLTSRPKSGTTIRLSQVALSSDKYAVSVHCQTTLVAEFKEIYSNMEYDGNRSIILDINDHLPLDVVKHFIYSALTYHHRKKHGIGI